MRRLFSAALAFFLTLLCLADICVWIRGYTTGDTLLYSWSRKTGGYQFVQLWTSGGGIRLMYAKMFDASNPVALLSWNPGLQHGQYSGPTYPFDKSSEGKSHHLLGFEFWRLDSSYPHLDRHFKSITFPHALLVILLALYPLAGAWKIIRIIRTYSKRPPLRFAICPKCGYDIRFCRDKCPECGASIESSLPDSTPHSTDHL